MPNEPTPVVADPQPLEPGFDDMFAPVSEEPISQEPTPDLSSPEPGKPDFPDGKRWQSAHDKLLNEVGPYLVGVDVMKKHPQLYSELLEKAKQLEVSAAPKQPERPAVPVRPSNYDPQEAVTNPDSSSYKYREALEKFQLDVIEYNDRILKSRLDELEQTRRELEQREFQKQQLARTRVELTQRGLTPAEQVDFLQTFSDENAISIDNLVELYKIKKRTSKPPGPSPSPQPRVPPPIPAPGAGGEPIADDDGGFSDGLLAHKGKR